MLSQKQTKNCASTYPFSGNFYGQCFSDNLPSSLPKEIKNNLKRRRPQLPQVVLSRSKICHSPINFSPSVQRTALKSANPESCMFLICSHATNEGSGYLIQIHYLAFQYLTYHTKAIKDREFEKCEISS